MSVMALKKNSINKAFNTVINICFDAPIHWGPVNVHDKLDHFDAEYLARWSSIFNERNYNQQYAHDKPWERHEYVFWRDWDEFVSRQALVQAIQTIKCIRYNVIENYQDSVQFKVLTDLEQVLIDIYLETSEEWKAAIWG